MMIKYQYQVIRYIHDQFTGEFGNIGVVLYSPSKNYLACKVVNRYARLSEFFGDINGHFLLSGLKRLEIAISKIAEDPNTFLAGKKSEQGLDLITSHILPKDDSALQFTDVVHGIDIDPEITLHDLFERIVERYNADDYASRHTDQYAWSKIYKNYFDKYGITKQLKKHKVVANNNDEIVFDKAWKNGVWNCYQTLSFDLKTDDAVKNKIYKWSGIIRALENAGESINLFFLTTSPKHKELENLIEDTLTVSDQALRVDIIKEDKADDFAANVRKEMEKSNILGPADDEPF
jgi:hypothetical protein